MSADYALRLGRFRIERAVQHATGSLEDVEIECELEDVREREIEAKLAVVNELCATDVQVGWIVRGITECKSASEILVLSGMSKLEYASAHRRWRRRLEKLFTRGVS